MIASKRSVSNRKGDHPGPDLQRLVGLQHRPLDRLTIDALKPKECTLEAKVRCPYYLRGRHAMVHLRKGAADEQS